MESCHQLASLDNAPPEAGEIEPFLAFGARAIGDLWDRLHRGEPRPAQWAIAHAALSERFHAIQMEAMLASTRGAERRRRQPRATAGQKNANGLRAESVEADRTLRLILSWPLP